ncbi:class I SAM-dependent methyltransferase [Neisseria zalophi]|uniref:Methyltransferase n=1 Tax=Neisseria zalophi TaxID=640030 RepID=A0A5J6PVW7_9NEIS|nr:methyltransferase [Neisseria zalophi]QEY26869.1 methyltransferase [Neisseria zalophi]
MNTDDHWQIHRLLAQNTDERLQLLRRTPQQIILVGADADESRRLLAARYPKAVFSEYDPRADALATAAEARQTGLWQKLTGKAVIQYQQAPTDPLPAAQADMLWSNLGMIHGKDPIPVLENWANALKTDGLLFFTHFGVDTLVELRGRLNAQGIGVEAPMLFDMHDLGDMLFHHGFYDPVMDTAKLELSYRKAETFWLDMETLGLWSSLVFEDPATAHDAINDWFATDKQLTITLETVYGHAVKKQILPQGESPVQFYPKKPA